MSAYIMKVKELAEEVKKTDLISGWGIEHTVDRMLKRERAFHDNSLSKLTKLKRITAYKRYDFKKSAGQELTEESERLALRHTVNLINGILQFNEVDKAEGTVTYTRTMDGFTARMALNHRGYHLLINNGNKVIFNRYGGVGNIPDNWVRLMNRIKNELNLGVMKRDWETSSDILALRYKVEHSNIEPIKARMRKALEDNGLLHRFGQICEGDFSVGNAPIYNGSRHSYDDIIRVSVMVHTMTFEEIAEGVAIVNEVLKREGYTEKYEGGI